MLKHRVVGLAAIALLFAGPALAQTSPLVPDPAAERLATEIVREQMTQIDLDQITAVSMQQLATAMRITDARQLADLQAITPVIKEELRGMLPVIAAMTSIFFTENFNVQELEELRAFYMSPTGRKMTMRSREFGARLGVSMQLAMQQRAPAIERRVREEMAKRGHKL